MTGTRVLFVNHTSIVSGAEMVLLDIVPAYPASAAFLFEDGALSSRLQSRGVEVIQSRFGGGFTKVKRDSSLTRAVPLAGRMSALAAELSAVARRYDVLYANSQKAFVLGAVAAALARRPLIWHLHDIISMAHFGRGQRKLQIRLANGFARCVVAPSQPVAMAFAAEGGRPELICVVPNGLDVDASAASKADLRQELRLPSGPLIGVFSRLAPWKGHHVVLRGLAQLPGVHCIIAGSALFGEDAYEASLRALAAKLEITDRVMFLGQRADVPRLMRAVDIVIHPSVDPEPFGRTLVEAMLVRTPVIATSAGASAEILEFGASGILVPPGDTGALVAAVRNTLNRPAALAAQTDRAEARAREVYGVAPMRKAIADVIGRVAREDRQ